MEPSPPTPVVLFLADRCELIERGCPSATRVLPKGADLIELPALKLLTWNGSFNTCGCYPDQ